MSTTAGPPPLGRGQAGSSVTRVDPYKSAVVPAGTAEFSPVSMHGEPGKRRALSSSVPGTPSGPSAPARSGLAEMLPAVPNVPEYAWMQELVMVHVPVPG